MTPHEFANGTKTHAQQFGRGYNLMGRNREESIAGIQGKLKKFLVNLASEGDIGKVYRSLIQLATECPDYKTRLAACKEYLIFATGKPTEMIAIDATAAPALDPRDVPQAVEMLKELKRQQEQQLGPVI